MVVFRVITAVRSIATQTGVPPYPGETMHAGSQGRFRRAEWASVQLQQDRDTLFDMVLASFDFY